MISAVIEGMCRHGCRQEVSGRLRDDGWLKSEVLRDVVIESTGCYWKPVLHILEDDPEYRLAGVLANAQQVKAVTGHKTDPHEARWLAHGLRHGMIRPSCIPPRAQRELRDLTRRRKQMVRGSGRGAPSSAKGMGRRQREDRGRAQPRVRSFRPAHVGSPGGGPIECWGGSPASTGGVN